MSISIFKEIKHKYLYESEEKVCSHTHIHTHVCTCTEKLNNIEIIEEKFNKEIGLPP